MQPINITMLDTIKGIKEFDLFVSNDKYRHLEFVLQGKLEGKKGPECRRIS